MEKLQDSRERQIMPIELLEHYIKARTDTYASGKDPQLRLNIVGLKEDDRFVYDRLVKFLGDHVSEVRFGKKVTFDFEDELGKWVYEGKGKLEDYGWHDDESITLNGMRMYKLRGTGCTFIEGF